MSDLKARLRESVIIRQGETVMLDMGGPEGFVPVSTGDIVQLRNPDGPEAASTLDAQEAEIAALRLLMREWDEIIHSGDQDWIEDFYARWDAAKDAALSSIQPIGR